MMLSLSALAAVLFILQSSVLPFFFNGTSQPDLFLVALSVLALVLDVRYVLMLAAVFGILQDVVIGNFFGLHLLPYLVVAWTFSKLTKEKFNRHWYVSLSAAAAGSVVFLVLSLLVSAAGGSALPKGMYFLKTGLAFLVLNAAAALLMHRILWSFRPESESRW